MSAQIDIDVLDEFSSTGGLIESADVARFRAASSAAVRACQRIALAPAGIELICYD